MLLSLCADEEVSIEDAEVEPSDADLAAIEAEMPLIQAERNVLAAEASLLSAVERGGPSPADWARLRRANRELIALALPRMINPAVKLAGSSCPCDPGRLQERRPSGCRYRCAVMRCRDCGAEQVQHRAANGCVIQGRIALLEGLETYRAQRRNSLYRGVPRTGKGLPDSVTEVA